MIHVIQDIKSAIYTITYAQGTHANMHNQPTTTQHLIICR